MSTSVYKRFDNIDCILFPFFYSISNGIYKNLFYKNTTNNEYEDSEDYEDEEDEKDIIFKEDLGIQGEMENFNIKNNNNINNKSN